MPLILTGTAASTTLDSSAGLTFSDSSNQSAAASPFGLKNRIINGDMRIDQRNAGAILTVTSSGQKYPVDRFYSENPTDGTFTVQQSTTAPAGFNNSYVATVTVADTNLTTTQFAAIAHQIEGYNVADMNFGTANAKTFTLSFWVQSSVTGTFGGSFRNSADNRSYPFSYTISVANTWEYKTITVAGDTTGTWITNNGIGLKVWFSLGAGPTYSGTANSWQSSVLVQPTGSTNLLATNGATFYITGVQLERNTTATPFEWLPYSTELALCQRYYWRFNALGNATIFSAGGLAQSTTKGSFAIQNPVSMRILPTAIEYASLGITLFATSTTAVTSAALVTATSESSLNFTVVEATVASGLTQFRPYNLSSSSASGYIAATAEL